MSKYYALIAGLPNLTVDAHKLPFSQAEYAEELEQILSKQDRKQLDWLRLEEANRDLLALLEAGELTPLGEDAEEREPYQGDSTLPVDELRSVAEVAARGGRKPRPSKTPAYMTTFVYEYYYKSEDEDAVEHKRSPLSNEDRLSQLYYAEAAQSSSSFVREWFRLNQTIRNTLAVFTCRRLGWDPERFVVGDTEVEEQLRTSRAKDFDLAETVPYISSLIQIAEEADISRRERQLDLLKWRWLDDATFSRVFDLDNVLAYYLRLGIIERWTSLDEETGSQVFRQIVHGLKRESNASLDEFRRNTQRK